MSSRCYWLNNEHRASKWIVLRDRTPTSRESEDALNDTISSRERLINVVISCALIGKNQLHGVSSLLK